MKNVWKKNSSEDGIKSAISPILILIQLWKDKDDFMFPLISCASRSRPVPRVVEYDSKKLVKKTCWRCNGENNDFAVFYLLMMMKTKLKM
jgi:hypothetical protein